jgi:adenine-specific DNA glycosylase
MDQACLIDVMVALSSTESQLKPDATLLLSWYDRHARILPWRFLPGTQADPYHVWLSEIMLQQTTVQAVKPYFEKFLLRWPRVETLAAADSEDIMRMWAGLGYYSALTGAFLMMKQVSSRSPASAIIQLPRSARLLLVSGLLWLMAMSSG